MTAREYHWRTWAIASLAILVAAAGLWSIQGRAWLSPASQGQPGDAKESADSDIPGMKMPGMDMKVRAESEHSTTVPGHANVTIPPEVQQRIGVTIGSVDLSPLRMSVQTIGIVRPDETKIARIHLRTEGWVQSLSVNFTGQQVHEGDPLLTLFSRDFVTTQQEYLTARRAEKSAGGASRQSLADSARRRLQLLDVPEEALEKLEQTGVPDENVTLRSPINGTVLKKNIQEKDYVTAEKELYVIADLSTVWVQAKVYEYEVPHVELGQPAKVTIPALPERELAGKVVFIDPIVEEPTRTIQVRIELPNTDGTLKPGMFAHVTIAHQMGEGLLVPTSAVIRTGEKDLAYRVDAPGTFVPIEITIDDVKFGDRFHVLEGLQAGDKVVTSANFLIDSESRLRAGAGGMAGMPGMEGMQMDQPDATEKDSGRMESNRPKNGGMKAMDHSKMK